MLDYLNRKEKILTFLKNGLITKKHSFKELAGMNGRLNSIKDIKAKYSYEILKNLIENTNYSILNSINDVKHGLNNVSNINKRKSDWYLYAINKTDIKDTDTEILRDSFLNNETLIYESEKSIGSGKFAKFYIIFSKKKYVGKQEYIANRWQER